MTNPYLEFINDCILFDPKHIEKDYSNIREEDLLVELERYRRFCIQNIIQTPRENNCLTICIEGMNFLPQEELLTQCALYVNRISINDPLFEYTLPKTEQSRVVNKYLGMQETGIHRKSLARSAKYINDLRKSIVYNFIELVPISYLHEPPKEIPILYSEKLFSDILPKEILDLFHRNARVSTMIKVESGWRIVSGNTLRPCRAISIEFEEISGIYFPYMLFQAYIKDIDPDTRTVTSVNILPDEPPKIDEFNSWVEQSINQASRRYFDDVIREVYFANELGSTYFTQSGFISQLLNTLLPIKTDLKSEVLNLFMEMDLPLIHGLTLNDILDIRQKDGEVFYNFRVELEKQLRELRTVMDKDELRKRLENVSHQLAEVEIHEIDKTIDLIKRKMIADAIILVGGLYTTFQTGGFGIPVLVYALQNGYKTFEEYTQNIKQNPAYFLWKIKH